MAAHVPPRIFRRVPFETAVRLRFDDFTGFVTEYSGNISLGGMFIRCDAPPPVGTTLDVEFKLDDDFDLIRGRGKVIWVRQEELGPDQPTGMGLRFAELTPGSRELIFQVVDRYVRQGGIPFDLEEEAAAASRRSASPVAPASPPAAPAPRATPEPPAARPRSPEPRAIRPPASAAPPAPAPERPFDLAPSKAAPSAPPPAGPPPAPAPAERDFAAELPGLDDVLPPRPEPAGPPSRQREREDDPGDDRPAGRGKRPRRRTAAAAAALVLVAAGALFAYRERLASWVVGAPEGAEAAAASAAGPAASPAARGAAGEPAAAAPAGGEGSAAATAGGEPDAPSPSAAEPAGAGGAGDRSGAVAGAVPAPVAAAPAPPAPSAAAATRLERITWSREGDATELVLWADGPFAPGAVRRSRLGGSQPREVLRIAGIAVPFAQGELAVGTGQVRRVRTGLHLELAPPELHVVVDLAGPAVEATAVEPEGARLRVRFEGR